MKDLIEFITLSLVDDPTQVEVTEISGRSQVTIVLKVAKEDMGRVIGRGGRVANAMRTLLRVAGAREGKKVILEVMDPQ